MDKYNNNKISWCIALKIKYAKLSINNSVGWSPEIKYVTLSTNNFVGWLHWRAFLI